jgi:hypothetical protein
MTKAKKVWGHGQVAEHLPSKCKALSSKSSTSVREWDRQRKRQRHGETDRDTERERERERNITYGKSGVQCSGHSLPILECGALSCLLTSFRKSLLLSSLIYFLWTLIIMPLFYFVFSNFYWFLVLLISLFCLLDCSDFPIKDSSLFLYVFQELLACVPLVLLFWTDTHICGLLFSGLLLFFQAWSLHSSSEAGKTGKDLLSVPCGVILLFCLSRYSSPPLCSFNFNGIGYLRSTTGWGH